MADDQLVSASADNEVTKCHFIRRALHHQMREVGFYNKKFHPLLNVEDGI